MANRKHKKTGVDILICDKKKLSKNDVIRNEAGHFIMISGRQLLSIYVPIYRGFKYMKQKIAVKRRTRKFQGYRANISIVVH